MLLNPEQLARKLARLQLQHPWKFLIFALVVTALTGIYASGIRFDSSYEALLPEGAEEVQNLDRVRDKTGGTRQLVIALSGAKPEKRLAFGRKVAPKLEKLDDVRVVDLEFPVDFFKDRALWMADLETLDKLIPALEEAVIVSKSQANPLALHLDEEEEKKELEAAWKKVEDITRNPEADVPFDTVLTSKDGKYTFLILVPSIKFSDMARGQALLNSIKDTIEKENPGKNGISVEYAGALEVIQEQHHVMQKDMVTASLLSGIFAILIMAGFTRRIMAPFVVGLSLVCGIVWTFAMARLYVGHVNIITGFLVAVLIGLGVDFGIHLFVRFQQEVRLPGARLDKAFSNFVAGTAVPASTAAFTTAGVFFTFTIADFRGFSEFGLIAGTGVLFTLFSSFLVLPPLMAVLYRNKPLKEAPQKATAGSGKQLPMGVALTVVVLLAALAGYGVYSITQVKFRNDFRELRGYSEATEFTDYVNENMGAGFNPAVFVAPTVEDATVVRDKLLASMERDADKTLEAKVGKVLAVTDLLPSDVEAHRKRIQQIDDIVWDRALNRAVEKEHDQGQKLRDARKMVRTEPWTIDDVPATFRRRFTTIESPPQYLVYTWSAERHDADYRAAAWETELKAVSADLDKDGVKHAMADETHILSWVYRLVKADAVPLLTIAGIVVLLLLILDFRKPKDVLLLLVPLSMGMLMFIGIAHLAGMDINMYNMIVFPSVIGIGIDNAVHILHRYQGEGRGSVVFVLRNTGVAALLASVTTTVGFGSSIVAHNLGLQSMGTMAIIGILATFVAAIGLLPCILTLLERTSKS